MEENNILKRISDKPYYISESEKRKLEETSEYIYKKTNKYLKHKTKKDNIIEFMRIDYAWDSKGKLKVLELNTCGPQGFIFIKESEKLNHYDNMKTLSPDVDFLAHYILKKLGKKVFIISSYISGNLGYEVEKFEMQFLDKKIKESGNECKIINFIENRYDIIKQIKSYNPTGIYIRGGLDISEEYMLEIINLKIPQIPSFESYFITENKSFLKRLNKYDYKNIVPKTYIINERNQDFLKKQKDKLVIKPSKSFGGKGIIFGEDLDNNTWNIKLQNILNEKENQNYIFQEKCFLKKEDNKYIDIAVYIVDDKVEGIISRTSKDKIVNIGNDGFLKPVILK